MSVQNLYYNNNFVGSVYYNGNQVQKVYYNNVLVWELNGEWDNVTWEQMYNTCLSVQQGGTFPSYYSIGNTKDFKIGDNTFSAKLVGINIEGRGTLTFQYQPTYNSRYYDYYTVDSNTSIFNGWPTSNLRELCQQDYNNSDIKPYVKTVSKQSLLFDRETTVTTNETFYIAGYQDVQIYDIQNFLKPIRTDYSEGYWGRDRFKDVMSPGPFPYATIYGDYFWVTSPTDPDITFGGSNPSQEFYKGTTTNQGSMNRKGITPFFVIG